MTALAADRKLKMRDQARLVGTPVTAATTLYGGSMVMRTTATGLALPAADTAGCTFAGVARERFVPAAAYGNTKGQHSEAELYQEGDFEFAYSAGNATQASVGVEVEIKDDQTVQLAGTATNHVKCGKIVGFISATSVMVRIDGYAF